MLKTLAVLAVFSLSLLAGIAPAIGDVFPGKIVIYPDRQEIQFPINSGVVEGINWPAGKTVHIEDVAAVIFNSDRVGWQNNSIAQSGLQPDGSCVISGTPNNDLGLWCVKLKSGEFCYCNFDPPHISRWEISSAIPNTPQPTLFTDASTGYAYFVKYGNYNRSSVIAFKPGAQARIQFNCSILCGLTDSRIDPANITQVAWNSDKVGWLENSTSTGTLTVEPNGNLLAVISNMPREDTGNFSFLKKDGSRTWLKIEFWRYERAEVSLDHQNGFVSYKFAADISAAINLLLLDQ